MVEYIRKVVEANDFLQKIIPDDGRKRTYKRKVKK